MSEPADPDALPLATLRLAIALVRAAGGTLEVPLRDLVDPDPGSALHWWDDPARHVRVFKTTE